MGQLHWSAEHSGSIYGNFYVYNNTHCWHSGWLLDLCSPRKLTSLTPEHYLAVLPHRPSGLFQLISSNFVKTLAGKTITLRPT